MTGPEAVPLLLGFAVLASCALGYFGLGEMLGSDRKGLASRLARISGKATAVAPHNPAAGAVRRDQSDSSIAGFDRLIKRYLPHPAKLRQRLARTGRRITLGEYVLGSLLTAGIVYLIVDFAIGWALVISIPLAITAGLLLPHKLVDAMAAARTRAFMAVFPESVELIVRGLKSGIPVMEAMKSVGNDMPDPVGLEFRRTLDAFNLGVPLNQALFDTAERLGLADFRFFAISISVQQQTGGNLAETLENLVDILRRRRQMALKVRAMSSEARATAMIVGSLPFLVFGALLVIAPAYIGVLLHDPRGHLVLGAAGVSMTLGGGIMRKMARFEI
jgi:tight adherence protein B